MCFELFMCAVVVALEGGLFDGSVHAFHLAVGPGMIDFSESVFNVMFLANTVKEAHRCRFILFAVGKLSAVIGQEGVYLVRQGRNDISQELYRGHLLFIRVSFGIGQLAGAVNGHKELQSCLLQAGYLVLFALRQYRCGHSQWDIS